MKLELLQKAKDLEKHILSLEHDLELLNNMNSPIWYEVNVGYNKRLTLEGIDKSVLALETVNLVKQKIAQQKKKLDEL